MGKPKDTIGSRDYGKRLYNSDLPYQEHMRRQTDAHYSRSGKVPHSEDKKPYLYPDMDFPELEYFRFGFQPPRWPDLPPDDPTLKNDPEINGYGGKRDDEDSDHGFLGCRFVPPYFTPIVLASGQTAWSAFLLGDGEPGVAGIEVSGPISIISDPEWMTDCGKNPRVKCHMIIRADDDLSDYEPDSSTGYIVAVVNVRTPSGGVCTAIVNIESCANPPALTWDTSLSPETIAASSSAKIGVAGGVPPFTWSVTGTDFSLSHTESASRTNSLVAGASACGVATITVTDHCGTSVEEIILCTTGSWTLDNSINASSLGWCCSTILTAGSNEEIFGKYKVVQSQHSYFCQPYNAPPVPQCYHYIVDSFGSAVATYEWPWPNGTGRRVSGYSVYIWGC